MEEEEKEAELVEVSVVEDTAAVPKECDLPGSEVTPQQLEEFERHRVDKHLNYSILLELDTAAFIRGLKILFLFTLVICVISTISLEQRRSGRYMNQTWDYVSNQSWLFRFLSFGPNNVVLLAVFAAVVAFGRVRKAWIKTRPMPQWMVRASERPRVQLQKLLSPLNYYKELIYARITTAFHFIMK